MIKVSLQIKTILMKDLYLRQIVVSNILINIIQIKNV